jgi:hypothetical protein
MEDLHAWYPFRYPRLRTTPRTRSRILRTGDAAWAFTVRHCSAARRKNKTLHTHSMY